MKVAVSVVAPERDAALDMRFGRAAAFVLVDTETDEWLGYANPAIDAAGGAGVQAAEFVVEKGAKAAISGAFGPNAHDVLSAANVKMYRATSGTAAELARQLEAGDLEVIEAPSRGGRRGGRGRRRGGRR